ncbi:MAG: nucleotide exchange factor GrpE [Oscillospiraceae bacterium]|nr:nucleotide exchange factor GrpE [Oscillospiraceae bacterium]
MNNEEKKDEILEEETPEAVDTEVVEPQSAEDETQKKLEALNDKYMRTLAEYDNYRKRSIREKEAIYPEAKADAAAKFLPVMDNLERALGIETEKNAFYEGVELVKKQLEEVFKNLGVEAISAEAGEEFNPELHNAVMHVEDEDYGENVIVEELQKGYKLGDRVLRHSMVKVAN